MNTRRIIVQSVIIKTKQNDLRKNLKKKEKSTSTSKHGLFSVILARMKKEKKCLMFTEGLCEGERCEQIVDLEALLDKAVDEGVVR